MANLFLAYWGHNVINDGLSVERPYRDLTNYAAFDNLTIYGGEYIIPGILNDTRVTGIGRVVLLPSTPTDVFFSNNRPSTYQDIIVKDFRTPFQYFNYTQNQARIIFIDNCVWTRNVYSAGFPFQLWGKGDQTATEEAQNIHVHQYDCEISGMNFTRKATFTGQGQIIFKINDTGQSLFEDCIFAMEDQNAVFESPLTLRNCVFSDGMRFDYDDGVSPQTNMTLATFIAQNTANSWGFTIENCITETKANMFVDEAKQDFRLKPASLASTASTTSGYVGKYRVGYTQLADVSFTNNTGYTFNVDRYEATGDATIDSPVISLGGVNRTIKTPYLNEINDFASGVAFDLSTILGTAVYSGSTTTGLSTALSQDVPYFVDGFTSVVTNQRNIPIDALNKSFTANAGEILNEVTGTGNIRPVDDLSGQRRIEMKWWKTTETEPATFKPVFLDGKKILLDSSGRTPAEPGYNPAVDPYFAVGADVRYRIKVSANYIKS